MSPSWRSLDPPSPFPTTARRPSRCAEDEVVDGDERPWLCPWSLPVGRPGHEAVRAICVVPVPHGDDAGHVAVVDSVPVLFGTDVGVKR